MGGGVWPAANTTRTATLTDPTGKLVSGTPVTLSSTYINPAGVATTSPAATFASPTITTGGSGTTVTSGGLFVSNSSEQNVLLTATGTDPNGNPISATCKLSYLPPTANPVTFGQWVPINSSTVQQTTCSFTLSYQGTPLAYRQIELQPTDVVGASGQAGTVALYDPNSTPPGNPITSSTTVKTNAQGACTATVVWTPGSSEEDNIDVTVIDMIINPDKDWLTQKTGQ